MCVATAWGGKGGAASRLPVPRGLTFYRMSPRVLLCALAVLAANAAAPAERASAQSAQSAPAALSRDELRAFAQVYIAVSKARDSADVEYSALRTKTPQLQAEIQERLQARIVAILRDAGMSNEEYRRRTYIVSVDDSVRTQFDDIVAEITGVPRPAPPAPPPTPAAQTPTTANIPLGPSGTHIGHVITSFADTPDRMGLLPVALAEARIAAQHAALAGRTPTNLDAMKLHAGHVIHAVDPTVVTMGPGRGYGVKRAAMGVASHIELAARAELAPASVVTHSVHVATSARNTIARADSLVAIAQRIRASDSATEAADLVSQMVSLAEQLIAGADANADGRITWAENEGGLQHAQEHMDLMLR